ncbi:MAG: HIT family protein [Acidimicrobiia bacterium]|nr:HIT family protein [Acidimicrobiia bacterium]MDH3463373.1 HIT family protein [Acidimicrobiia bacterium]
MATIFSRIIAGEIPGTFVWRDAECVAFMTIEPIRTGHTLVVPVQEIDHWIDLPGPLRDHLMSVSSQVARAIQEAFDPVRVGLMIAGLEVPHTHIHLVPIEAMRDLDFANADSTATRDQLEEAAERIRQKLRSHGAAGVSS